MCTLVLALFSCSGKTDNVGSSSQQEIETLSCVVLLPTAIPYDESVIGNTLHGDLEKGSEFLDNILKSKLKQSQVTRIVYPEQLKPQVDGVSGGKSGVIKEIGESSRCNAVLVTTLSEFKQRQGGEFAVDAPASAAFELRLVDAESGNSLWIANFNETQVALLRNLFSFSKAKSRGFKWITVEELVTQGLEEKLKDCPYLF